MRGMAFLKVVPLCLTVTFFFLIAMPAAVAVGYAENNTAPYAIVYSSAPGGGLTQNFGISVINITSGDVENAHKGQYPAWGVAISPDGKYLYLVNELGSCISVMDARNRTVVGTVDVGMYPQDAVVSPDGSRIYVSSAQPYYSDTISVIYAPMGGVATTIKTSISPGKMAISPDGTRLYVAQSFYSTYDTSSDIMVVDTTHNTMTGVIRAGKHPASIAVSPDGSRLYVACMGTGVVSSIDAETGRTIATAKTGRSPVDVTLSKDGSRLYAVNDYFGRSFVSVINASDMSMISRIDLPGHDIEDIRYSTIKRIVAAEGGSTIYVTDYALNAVYAINVSSGSIEAIDAGNSPSGLALSHDGLLYVTSKGSGGLAIINTTAGMSVEKASYAMSPAYVAITVDGKKAYVTNGDVGTVSVLNTNSREIVSTIDAGGIMNKIAMSPDGKRAYVAETRGGNIVLIDTATDTVAGNWSVGAIPMDVATSPDGSIVYVVHSRKGSKDINYDLSTLEAATGKALSTYELGGACFGLAVSPDGKKLYVCKRDSETVLVVDASTGKVISRIKTSVSPNDVKVSPDGSLVYVACPDNKTISVIDARTNSIIDDIGLQIAPRQIAITPDGTTAYATGADGVAVIDLKDRKMVRLFSIYDARGIAINPAMREGQA